MAKFSWENWTPEQKKKENKFSWESWAPPKPKNTVPANSEQQRKDLFSKYYAGKPKTDPNIDHTKQWFEDKLGPLAKPITGYANLIDKFSNTTAGKFSDRAGQTAVRTMMLDEKPSDISTGSKGLDFTADLLGMGAGFVTPGGPASGIMGVGAKAGTKLSSGIAEKVAPKLMPTLNKTASKLAPKLGSASKVVNKGLPYVGSKAIQGATMGGIYGTGKAIANNKPLSEVPLEAGKEALLWGALDPGAGVAFKALKPAISKAGETLSPLVSKIRDSLFKGKLEPIEIPEVAATIEPRESLGTMKVKNTKLEKAINKYNEAIETIQNHFKTNQLRTDEVGRIKGELGIDLEKLVRDIEQAEKGIDLRKLGEKGKMSRVAGLTDTPKLEKRVFNTSKTPAEPMSLPPVREIRTPETGDINVGELKDITGFKSYTKDVYRIFEDVFGKQFNKVKKRVLDPFDSAKKENVELQRYWLDKLKKEVVDKLGIGKGSKLSSLVQKYGEGGTKYFDEKTGRMVSEPYTLEDLKRDAPNDWQKVIEADKWFRKAYNELLDNVNKVRQQIYPNNPEKFVPKRDDYYRHFKEFTDLTGLRNIFETPAQIDPSLVGTSEFTKPRSKFAGFMQKRGLGKYKQDAVGGFLDYIPAASYSIKIDPQISNFRQLEKELKEVTGDSKNLNNFINFLNKFSQDLAGKTNPADRFIQEFIPGGRQSFNAINWINNRIKANVILGNLGSSLSQLANIPAGLAFAKDNSIKGAGRALNSIFKESKPMSESGFLKERFGGYGSDMYRQFDTKLLDQPKKFAQWLLETSDRIGTTFIWNSSYEKALSEGVEDAVKYADDATRKLVAGRGVGEVPLIQKSKLFQVAAPFQLEVGNLWHVMKDFVNAKDFGGLATLFVANYLFNNAMENVRGSRVVFDPIQAMVDASEEELTPAQRAGRIGGEVLSNVPGGQSVAAAIVSPYTRQKLFGDNDPTRYGAGLLPDVARNFTNVVTGNAKASDLMGIGSKALLNWGGGQISKSVRGAAPLIMEGVYTDSGFGNKLKYPIKSNPVNAIKGLAFGPSAFSESGEFYDKDRRELSERQTKEFNSLVSKGRDPKQLYESLMDKRRAETLKRKASEVKKDKELTREEKIKKLEKLKQQYMELSKK